MSWAYSIVSTPAFPYSTLIFDVTSSRTDSISSKLCRVSKIASSDIFRKQYDTVLSYIFVNMPVFNKVVWLARAKTRKTCWFSRRLFGDTKCFQNIGLQLPSKQKLTIISPFIVPSKRFLNCPTRTTFSHHVTFILMTDCQLCCSQYVY